MKYYHCPKEFYSKPYGCGFGPVNATQAFLDMGNKCRCGKDLKPHNNRKEQLKRQAIEMADAFDFVKEVFGQDAFENYSKTKDTK
jgi:hypothetical protein